MFYKNGNNFAINQGISGDISGGFNIANSYDLEITIKDRLSIKIATTTILGGEPAIAFFKNNVSIGGQYDESRSDQPIQFNKSAFDKNGKEILGETVNPYPIGSIYISVSNVNPSTVFGGTWVAFATGRTLVGVDTSQTEFNTVKKTGGHKELQSHTHTFSGTTGGGGAHNHQSRGYYQQRDGAALSGQRNMANTTVPGDPLDTNSLVAAPNHTHQFSGTTESRGSGNSENLQPYITVYMWERTG